MRDARTAKYIIKATFEVDEQNSYGDLLSTGTITFTAESKAKDLAELGSTLANIQHAMKGDS